MVITSSSDCLYVNVSTRFEACASIEEQANLVGGVGVATGVPHLQEERCALALDGGHNRLPGLHLLLGVDAGDAGVALQEGGSAAYAT